MWEAQTWAEWRLDQEALERGPEPPYVPGSVQLDPDDYIPAPPSIREATMSDYHYDPRDSAPFAPRKFNRDDDGQILFAGSGNNRKAQNPMESAPTYIVANPLAESIAEGDALIERIQIAADDLAARIAEERGWFAKLREAESTYEMTETEALAEIVILATTKDGPLGGVAATSKAYDLLLANQRNQLRTGRLQRLWQSLEYVRRNYEQAQVAMRQAETNFAALRKAVELKASTLRAAAL